MATDQQYQDFVEDLDKSALVRLWEDVEAGRRPSGWRHADWCQGRALEYVVLQGFRLDGADVAWPYRTEEGDFVPGGSDRTVEQTDGVVYVDGLACVIECRAQQNRLGVEPLAYLRNKLLRRPAAAIGSFFSLSGFTDPALLLAGYMFPQTILLWEGDEVEAALVHGWFAEGLRVKYRAAVETGATDRKLSVYLP
jgi:hypothetical protein